MATNSYIKQNSSKLIDNIFSMSPLLSWAKRAIIEDEYDDFDLWAFEVRAKAGLPTPLDQKAPKT